MPFHPMLDQVAALTCLEIRGQVARHRPTGRDLIARSCRFVAGHLPIIGWSWLTIVIATPLPPAPSGDRRRTGC